MIKQYIRDEKRNPQGVVVVVKEGNDFRFGYSLCSPNDQFDKRIGTQIAINRALCSKLGDDEHLVPTITERREKVLNYYTLLEKNADNFFQTKG